MQSLPVYFIHGFGGSKYNFIKLEKEFPGSKSIGLPGFGYEDRPAGEYDLEFYLDFLKTQIKERCILVGHSMGAYLSQEFALAYPELVEKVCVIGYPVNKNSRLYKKNTYLTQTVFTKRIASYTYLLEKVKPIFAKVVGYVANVVFAPYGKSFECFLIVPNYILTRVWKNTVLPSDTERLLKLQQPVILINGDHDAYNKSISSTFSKYGKSFVLKGMSHQFFNYEEKIAEIIREYFLH